MSLPLSLPDWMPGWLFLALAVPALLWVLAFLMVPFSVFGVKARLEALEGELNALHEELRVMQMRAAGVLPAPVRGMDSYDEVPNFGQLKRGRAAQQQMEESAPPPASRAPIPNPEPRGGFGKRDISPPRERPAAPPPRPRRTEPRLD
ncbi:hypothetical protein [Acidocella sp.]|uniref:hypothetical protein n=1 Tax=Acidocella sp. TaxID=50710 RepID=UPI003CFD00C7